MINEDIGPQAVAVNGAVVASESRFVLVYAARGRVTRVAVEPLGTYYVRPPAHPAWGDGAPLTPAEQTALRTDVVEALAHWGIPAVVVEPDDPGVFRTVGELATWIRSRVPAR